jgi:Glycosyltransferase
MKKVNPIDFLLHKENNKVKIAMIIPNLDIAGAQIMMAELLSELVKTDNKFLIIVLHKPQNNFLSEKLKLLNIPVKYVITESKGHFRKKIELYKKMSKILSNWQPDTVHAHLEYRYAWLYCLWNKTPIVQTIHSQPYRIKSASVLFLYKLLRGKSLIYPVVVTKNNAHEFGKLFHETEENIYIIPNPINCEKFAVLNRAYSSETINFVFIARFEEIKNHDMLLKALHIAEKKVPNICLKLAGDGALLEKEKQFAEQLGIKSKVIFMGQRNDIPDILRESDVCVISSKSEAFSLSLVEAMAAGLPVIATAVGGMKDIVEGNGYLVKNDDENAFADAMIDLATDESKRRLMGEQSVKLAKRYDTPLVAKQYIKLYENNIKK